MILQPVRFGATHAERPGRTYRHAGERQGEGFTGEAFKHLPEFTVALKERVSLTPL